MTHWKVERSIFKQLAAGYIGNGILGSGYCSFLTAYPSSENSAAIVMRCRKSRMSPIIHSGVKVLSSKFYQIHFRPSSRASTTNMNRTISFIFVRLGPFKLLPYRES